MSDNNPHGRDLGSEPLRREGLMVSALLRMREPALWLVLAAMAITEAISLVSFLTGLGRGWTVAAEQARSPLGVLWPLLAVALVACLLIRPVTARVRQLSLLSAALVIVGALLGVAYLVGTLAGHQALWAKVLDATGRGLELLVQAAVAWVVWRLARLAPSRQAAQSAALEAAQAPVAARPRISPVWRAEDAVGTQWMRAGDAATGAEGQRFGTDAPGNGPDQGGVVGPGPAGAGQPAGLPELPSQNWTRGGQASVPPSPAVFGAGGGPRPWATAGQLASGQEPAGQSVQDQQPSGTPGSRPAPDWRPAR